jgi:hypothetical protein
MPSRPGRHEYLVNQIVGKIPVNPCLLAKSTGLTHRYQQFSGFPGFRHLLGWPDESRGIGMGRQLIAMGMGMGIMTGRKRRLWLRVVSCVRIGMIHGVVPFLLIVAFRVLAGM